MSKLGVSGLGLGFSSQGGVVDLQLHCLANSHVRRHSVSKLNLNDITEGELVGLDGDLFAVTKAEGILGNEILERLHDLGRLALLVVREDSGDNDDHSENDSKIKIVIWGLFVGPGLNGVSDEAKNGSKPEKESKASKEVLAELDPFRGGGRRGETVHTVLLLCLGRLRRGQSGLEVGAKALDEFVELDLVDVELELLLQIVQP